MRQPTHLGIDTAIDNATQAITDPMSLVDTVYPSATPTPAHNPLQVVVDTLTALKIAVAPIIDALQAPPDFGALLH